MLRTRDIKMHVPMSTTNATNDWDICTSHPLQRQKCMDIRSANDFDDFENRQRM